MLPSIIFWILYSIGFLICGLVVLYIYIIRKHNYWRKRGVKSVQTSSIFGNFSECLFAKKPLRIFFSDIYFLGKDEKFIGFYVFSKPFLLLRDPEMIKNMLVRDFKNFSNRCMSPNHSDYYGSTNMFTLKNPAWKALRHNLSSIFTSSKLKNRIDLMLEVSEDLDSHLQSIVKNDSWNVVEVKEVCEKFTMDVIGSTLFGMKLNSLKNSEAEFLSTGKQHFDNNYKQYFTLLSLQFMPLATRLLGLRFFPPDIPKFFKQVIPEAISERIKSKGKRNDLVDAFINIKETYQNKNDELHYYFQEDGIVATSIVFFLGGFEPSASIAYLTLYELAKYPEIQNKLRHEISNALKETGRKITYEMVTSLQYLDMVTSEGLRKHPLLHFIDREAAEDYTFPDTNVTIEKGTPVIIPLSGLHMDPKYFPNPDVFDPERFSDENKKNIQPFTYLPFGEGPRNCIGMRIGLAQSKILIIHIISKYELAPCKETPIPLVYDSYSLFTKSLNNMNLNVRRL